MESLRWILLAAGIVFVLIIYMLGRSRRRRNNSMVDELDDDLPEFSARSLDDMDEGVGAVRVISGEDSDVDDIVAINASIDGSSENEHHDNAVDNAPIDNEVTESSTDKAGKTPSDIIVLYILPKADEVLIGSQINSAAQAMGLSFGDMNIFHYKPKGSSVFSLANMLEPGSFDADTIHDLKTSGLTVFMQIKAGDPLDDLTEMLQRSYQLAGLLGARLCNHKREVLTEQDAENYRGQVSAFINRSPAAVQTEYSTEQ